jgi:hypothetical protein
MKEQRLAKLKIGLEFVQIRGGIHITNDNGRKNPSFLNKEKTKEIISFLKKGVDTNSEILKIRKKVKSFQYIGMIIVLTNSPKKYSMAIQNDPFPPVIAIEYFPQGFLFNFANFLPRVD